MDVVGTPWFRVGSVALEGGAVGGDTAGSGSEVYGLRGVLAQPAGDPQIDA